MQQSPLGSSLYYLVEIKSSGSQWALLHSNRKNLVATDKIHYK
ncbi:hypothetical protein [Wolbachia endosymbiont (group A) of Rhinocyllus conicus]|nr:hypothetical protein [Wolbachia endosymbiont (group A) of Rhinocyllus conicus]